MKKEIGGDECVEVRTPGILYRHQIVLLLLGCLFTWYFPGFFIPTTVSPVPKYDRVEILESFRDLDPEMRRDGTWYESSAVVSVLTLALVIPDFLFLLLVCMRSGVRLASGDILFSLSFLTVFALLLFTPIFELSMRHTYAPKRIAWLEGDFSTEVTCHTVTYAPEPVKDAPSKRKLVMKAPDGTPLSIVANKSDVEEPFTATIYIHTETSRLLGIKPLNK